MSWNRKRKWQKKKKLEKMINQKEVKNKIDIEQVLARSNLIESYDLANNGKIVNYTQNPLYVKRIEKKNLCNSCNNPRRLKRYFSIDKQNDIGERIKISQRSIEPMQRYRRIEDETFFESIIAISTAIYDCFRDGFSTPVKEDHFWFNWRKIKVIFYLLTYFNLFLWISLEGIEEVLNLRGNNTLESDELERMYVSLEVRVEYLRITMNEERGNFPGTIVIDAKVRDKHKPEIEIPFFIFNLPSGYENIVGLSNILLSTFGQKETIRVNGVILNPHSYESTLKVDSFQYPSKKILAYKNISELYEILCKAKKIEAFELVYNNPPNKRCLTEEYANNSDQLQESIESFNRLEEAIPSYQKRRYWTR